MKETIQLHEIAGYLPYGLKILREGKVMELCGLSAPYKTNDNYFVRGETKNVGGTYKTTCSFLIDDKRLQVFNPILRQMYDLDIVHFKALRSISSRVEVGINYVWFDGAINLDKVREVETYLLKNHFDIHNLIGRGLAIDINTLKD